MRFISFAAFIFFDFTVEKIDDEIADGEPPTF